MALFIYAALFITLAFSAWLTVRVKSGFIPRLAKILFSIAFFLLFFELGAALLFYWNSGNWFYSMHRNRNSELFEPHPYLIGTNKKDINKNFNGYNFSHNSLGFRGKEVSEKTDDIIRIAAIGGSTTYGVGVNDYETWPYYLDSILGNRFSVINIGVPGHSSVEHIVMAAFTLPELKADVVLVHAGLNDLRNSNVNDLQADYSNFHAPTIYESLGFCYREKLPLLASVRMSVHVLQHIGWYPSCILHRSNYTGESKVGIDQRVLKLYERNIETLAGILQNQGKTVYFLPQVLNTGNFTGDNYQWWAPYIPDSAIKATSDSFNLVMKNVAEKYGITYARDLEKENWAMDEFSDPSHLNREGNLKFANWVAELILKSDTIHE